MMYAIRTGHGKYFQRRGCVLSTQSVLPTFYDTLEGAESDVREVKAINQTMQNKGLDNKLAEPEIIEWEIG